MINRRDFLAGAAVFGRGSADRARTGPWGAARRTSAYVGPSGGGARA